MLILRWMSGLNTACVLICSSSSVGLNVNNTFEMPNPEVPPRKHYCYHSRAGCGGESITIIEICAKCGNPS